MILEVRKMNKTVAIIEIGSNNTKTHIYENGVLKYENNTTIEFKKNYSIESRITGVDLEKLFELIRVALKYTNDVHIYGCSIFRNISTEELASVNEKLYRAFNLKLEVVSQEEEAKYTALGCYGNIDYKGSICIFIGGGGSIELIFVEDGKIKNQKFYDFGVVDVTNKFPSLKSDIPKVTFEEVYKYVDELTETINAEAEVLILAGGDHLYWYNNAKYELLENTLYEHEKQKYMLTAEMNDVYDRDALVTSLDKIRQNSDNPLWFDGSRAMKVITNMIAHKVGAKYIIPTKINMEDGLKNSLDSK